MLPPTPTATPPASPHASKRPLSRPAAFSGSAPLHALPPLATELPETRGPQPQLTIEAFSRPGGPLAAPPPHFDPSPPPSPTKKERWSFIRTGSIRGAGPRREASPDRRPDARPPLPKLADWFQGESRPVRLGVLPSPSKELADPMPLTGERPPARPARAANPFLAFFGPKQSASAAAIASPTPSPTRPAPPTDPLLALDIPAALAPPATLDAAISLAQNLQAAHRALTTEHAGLAAEFAARTDELAEARTRAQHVQAQLRVVAGQLAERDATVVALREALGREAEQRAATLRLVDPAESAMAGESVVRAVEMSRTASLASTAPSAVFSEAGRASASSVSDAEGEAPAPLPRVRLAVAKTGVLRREEAAPGREENAALRARVQYLEAEMDGCLEMVKLMGL